MVTVHLILNAHIDPVWLWPWPSGLDAVLATCRSACERLEAHPDVHFCRGEAWAYDQIERVAPDLFARIRKHVEAGRWHIVGGWWIQPDCNGPSGFALQKQIDIGKQYFLERFGFFPRAAYNVDTFGHAASLPALLRATGQDRYVMMRPQEHELALPGRLFRWRGHADGPEVVTFCIAGAYACRELTEEHIRAALTDLPAGIEHTMCFVGLGDHGGGPTERQIAWIHEHANAINGCRLEFSWPDRFFDAIWPQKDKLPQFTGELQSHAIGCYSVHRSVKLGVRRAEHELTRAEIVRANDPQPELHSDARLAEAWRYVCFAHFHDTFGGTCIPSAYEQVHAQLGLSFAVADEITQLGMRRLLEKLPDDPLYRIVLFNASDTPFDGYATHEPWFVHAPYEPHWRLLDEQGQPVSHQAMHPEALVQYDRTWFLRLLFRVHLEPGGLRVLRVDPSAADRGAPADHPTRGASRVLTGADWISTHGGVAVLLGREGELQFPEGRRLPLPRLDLLEDTTDTWSHGVDRYGDEPVAGAVWGQSSLVDAGPLMASLQRPGRIGSSDVLAEYRVYADEPFVELLLRVYWCERHKLLKLTLPLPAPLGRRWDGIPGGDLTRPPDGSERPVRDRSLLELAGGTRVGLVLPDAYTLDATPPRVRITLLRSALLAQHDPYPGSGPRGVFSDQGVHEFRFRVFCGEQVSGVQLDHQTLMLHRPLITADLTRGMPP